MDGLAKSAPLTSAGSREGSWWTAIAKSIRQRNERKRTERQFRRDIGALMIADDRLLADVGLTREEVEHVARYGRLPTR
jgi:uncharacterized protein YjiS (DUF1127 family)